MIFTYSEFLQTVSTVITVINFIITVVMITGARLVLFIIDEFCDKVKSAVTKNCGGFFIEIFFKRLSYFHWVSCLPYERSFKANKKTKEVL